MNKELTIEFIEDFFETNINLNDYDLGGVEIVEDDFKTILERANKNTNKNLEDIISDYLYEIREILDAGLEDIDENEE